MNPFSIIGHLFGVNLATSLIDNLLWTTDSPVRGSVVYCDLAFGMAEHSGIYIGRNRIVHRNSRGIIEEVSLSEFLDGTTAITIYVSCDNSGNAVGGEDIASAAESMIGHQQDYSLFQNNCHQFCSYCVSGDWGSNSILLKHLKQDAKLFSGATQWRAWNLRTR
jgi:hypothetical protein